LSIKLCIDKSRLSGGLTGEAMIRGLYTSGYSMLELQKQMDVISNNLANANTTAYKKDTMVYESFPELLTKRINDTKSSLNPSGVAGNMQLGYDVSEIYTYYNQGQLMNTGNNLDAAIDGSDNAFFSVMVPDENGNMSEFYTRDGAFTLSPDGTLSTKDGYAVEGQNGPVKLSGDSFTINPDGTIVQNGQAVDKLLIKEFTDPTTLRKYGSNLVQTTDNTQEQDFSGTIKQGYLEQSNVNIVKEMVDMITVMRSYEANQKILQAQDNTLEKAVNEVGAVK
jgi:flagellar basal-body rod protein FlgG